MIYLQIYLHLLLLCLLLRSVPLIFVESENRTGKISLTLSQELSPSLPHDVLVAPKNKRIRKELTTISIKEPKNIVK